MQRHKDKFRVRGQKFVFVGYLFGKRGWKLYDLENEELFTSRDVVFEEIVFPYLTKTSSSDSVPQSVQLVPGTEVLEQLLESRGSDEETPAERAVLAEPMEIAPVDGPGTEEVSMSGE